MAEITGNDDVMLPAVGWDAPDLQVLNYGSVMARIPPDGYDGICR